MRSEFVPVSVQAAEAWRVANRGGELTEEQAGHLDRLKQEVTTSTQNPTLTLTLAPTLSLTPNRKLYLNPKTPPSPLG